MKSLFEIPIDSVDIDINHKNDWLTSSWKPSWILRNKKTTEDNKHAETSASMKRKPLHLEFTGDFVYFETFSIMARYDIYVQVNCTIFYLLQQATNQRWMDCKMSSRYVSHDHSKRLLVKG